MPSTGQTNKELDHIFFNLFWLDPEYEEDWNEENLIFMKILSDVASKHVTCAIVLLSHEELSEILRKIKSKANMQGTNHHFHLSGDVRSLQFYLSNLKEKRMFSLDSSFDYSSIDESDFRNFWKYPDCIVQISNG